MNRCSLSDFWKEYLHRSHKLMQYSVGALFQILGESIVWSLRPSTLSHISDGEVSRTAGAVVVMNRKYIFLISSFCESVIFVGHVVQDFVEFFCCESPGTEVEVLAFGSLGRRSGGYLNLKDS